LGANPVSGRAKFTDRRDCRSPEAIERRRLERRDRSWVKPHQPPVVSVTPPSRPDFGVKTPDCGQWSSDGRYFLWQPPPKQELVN
jgi:hypothetical protein